jgi:hypothetical protein
VRTIVLISCASKKVPHKAKAEDLYCSALYRLNLFTGGMKLVLPLEVLTEQFPLPGLFVWFLGVAEVLGAIGLVLPGFLGIRPGLTPLAAAGLLIIMSRPRARTGR